MTAMLKKRKLLLHGTLQIGPSLPLKNNEKQKQKNLFFKRDNFVLP
jgi:hypothetical protein